MKQKLKLQAYITDSGDGSSVIRLFGENHQTELLSCLRDRNTTLQDVYDQTDSYENGILVTLDVEVEYDETSKIVKLVKPTSFSTD